MRDKIVKEVNKEIGELEEMLEEIVETCSLRKEIVRKIKKLPRTLSKIYGRKGDTS